MITIETPTLAELARKIFAVRGVVPDKLEVSLPTLIAASNEVHLINQRTGKPIFIKREGALLQIDSSPIDTPLHGLMVFGVRCSIGGKRAMTKRLLDELKARAHRSKTGRLTIRRDQVIQLAREYHGLYHPGIAMSIMHYRGAIRRGEMMAFGAKVSVR